MDTYEYLTNVLQLENKDTIRAGCQNGVIQPVAKGETIFREGERPEYVALSVEGIFRGYFVSEEDEEITDCIISRPGISIMPGFDMEAPAPAAVESLTGGHIFKIPMTEFREMTGRYSDIMNLYTHMLCCAGMYHMEKSRVISCCSASKRYQWFLKTHSEIVNRIPDKYIASFLRMTTVTLSKVRKKMAVENQGHGAGWQR